MDSSRSSWFPDPADRDFCRAVLDRIYDLYWDDLDASILPEAHRTIVLVDFANGYIRNGGFRALFEGEYTGDPHLELTARAFRAIGCPAAIEAFDRAFRLFPGGKVPSSSDRRLALFLRTDAAERDAIDTMFMSAGRQITACLATYIRRHPEAFGAS